MSLAGVWGYPVADRVRRESSVFCVSGSFEAEPERPQPLERRGRVCGDAPTPLRTLGENLGSVCGRQSLSEFVLRFKNESQPSALSLTASGTIFLAAWNRIAISRAWRRLITLSPVSLSLASVIV